MKFLGIDLGWQSQPSGACCLVRQGAGLQLANLSRLATVEQVLNWVDAQVLPEEPAIIAVDAPTLIANPSGMRLADRLTHKYFGRYHAGSYPANLSRPFARQTVNFGRSLESRGFVHAPEITPQQPGRYQIEVFPHPAIVQLFGLPQILKYKKGTVTARRLELLRYRQYISEVLPTLEPNVKWSENAVPLPEIPQTGLAMKAVEDQLDSLICAYVAAHWWYWGRERNWVLGADSPEVCRIEGYIVVPALVR
ncbi:MAG: DUF429 domain-containing protein [Synechococcales cyanobacterium M58_A2018_015]|nr:DUF429 domain-containing protein [Synechococcales cyanobacterium M58_A2018_015]